MSVIDTSDVVSRDDGGSIVYAIDVPGTDKKDVSVSIESGILSVSWTKRVLDSETRGMRRFSIPRSLDPSSVDARIESGILYLTIGKRPGDVRREIEVR